MPAPWKPGQSGNPAGKPQSPNRQAWVATLKERYSDKLLTVFDEALANPKTKFEAAKLIAEHIYGKPHQVIAGSDSSPIEIKIITEGNGIFASRT